MAVEFCHVFFLHQLIWFCDYFFSHNLLIWWVILTDLLHTKNKQVYMVYDSFYMLLDLFCCYIVEDFCIYALEGYWSIGFFGGGRVLSVWFWHPCNASLIKWFRRHSLLFSSRDFCRIGANYLNVWWKSPVKHSRLGDFFFWKLLNYKFDFLNSHRKMRLFHPGWVLVVCGFQRIGPFHLNVCG